MWNLLKQLFCTFSRRNQWENVFTNPLNDKQPSLESNFGLTKIFYFCKINFSVVSKFQNFFMSIEIWQVTFEVMSQKPILVVFSFKFLFYTHTLQVSSNYFVRRKSIIIRIHPLLLHKKKSKKIVLPGSLIILKCFCFYISKNKFDIHARKFYDLHYNVTSIYFNKIRQIFYGKNILFHFSMEYSTCSSNFVQVVRVP